MIYIFNILWTNLLCAPVFVAPCRQEVVQRRSGLHSACYAAALSARTGLLQQRPGNTTQHTQPLSRNALRRLNLLRPPKASTVHLHQPSQRQLNFWGVLTTSPSHHHHQPQSFKQFGNQTLATHKHTLQFVLLVSRNQHQQQVSRHHQPPLTPDRFWNLIGW